MLNVVIIIIYGLIALGIMVLVHEFGHFIFAKSFGVRVEEFAIGFGSTPLQFKKGGTTYKIGYIPLGGYCKMAGEEPGQKLTGAPDEFYSKPPLQRLAIIFAGPALNYIFGLIIFIIIMMIGFQQITFSNKIYVPSTITINDKQIISPALAGGLKSDDEIIAINGEKVANWDQIRKLILISGDKNYNNITVKRGEKILECKVKPVINPDTGASLIGIQFYMNNKISELIIKDPAQKAGLKKGDEILKINNINMHSFSDIKFYVSKRPNQILNILVNRNNKLITIQLKAKAIKNTGFLGVVFDSPLITYLHKSKNILAAIGDGFQQTLEVIKNIIYSLETMISGKIKVSQAVAGPPRIIYMLGELAQKAEFMGYFRFIAFISIALGVFNLLPIPAVDGSYIFIFLFEILLRRPFNFKEVRNIQTVQYVGFVLLLGLLFLVSYNDIFHLIKSHNAVEQAIDYFNGIIV